MSPRETIFNGEILTISSVNSAGKFDILPEHANFITIIEKNPIIVQQIDKSYNKYEFHEAIIYAKDDQVLIYADPTTGGPPTIN